MLMVNAATAGVVCHVPASGGKRSRHGACEQGRYVRGFYSADEHQQIIGMFSIVVGT
ncbi:hypothetical protein ACFPTO_00345 [Paraburkholderia denitrificans]|uniref:Uncharacterized protein n=1 Tax=Paraburkholderia denitrificans TaxID=694025 RepID=A0ABW0J2M3_9BURK